MAEIISVSIFLPFFPSTTPHLVEGYPTTFGDSPLPSSFVAAGDACFTTISGVGCGVGSGGTPSTTSASGVAHALGEMALAVSSLLALFVAPLATTGSLEEDVLEAVLVVAVLVVAVLVSGWSLASGLVLVVLPGAPLCTILVHWSPERRSSRVGL